MKFTRGHAQAGFAALVVIAVVAWFISATEWVDVVVPPELHGPAKTDQLYAFKRFTKALGVELKTPDNLDQLPPPGATLVLSSWFWDMFPERNEALKRWVKNGGHLVVPTFEYSEDTLSWTTIFSSTPPPRVKPAASGASASPSTSKPDADGEDDEDDEDSSATHRQNDEQPAEADQQHGDAEPPASRRPPTTTPQPTPPVPGRPFPARRAPNCPGITEPTSVAPAFERHRTYTSCISSYATLKTPSQQLWAVDNSRGHVILRVASGLGMVTAVNARLPIYGTALLEPSKDEALLLAAVMRLERGQQLWLVTEEKRPPLLATLWSHGAPVILLGALALALALWRNGVRFGPRMAAPPVERRSVGEQIRGTSEFVAHHGGRALHRAQLRALEICARGIVPGYDALIVGERAAAIAPLVNIDTHTLARAMNPELGKHLPSALAVLETARRRLLLNTTNPTPE